MAKFLTVSDVLAISSTSRSLPARPLSATAMALVLDANGPGLHVHRIIDHCSQTTTYLSQREAAAPALMLEVSCPLLHPFPPLETELVSI